MHAATLVRLFRQRSWNVVRAGVSRGVFPAPLFRWYRAEIVRLVATAAAPPSSLPAGMVLRWATPDDTRALARVRRRAVGYERDFRVARPLLLTIDGEPAAFEWVSVAPLHVSSPNGYTFFVGPSAAWVYGVEVARAFRGRHVFAAMARAALDRLGDEGIDRIYSAVLRDNPASLRAHYGAGFETMYDLRILRLAGLVWHDARPSGTLPLPSARGLGPWHGADPATQPLDQDRRALAG